MNLESFLTEDGYSQGLTMLTMQQRKSNTVRMLTGASVTPHLSSTWMNCCLSVETRSGQSSTSSGRKRNAPWIAVRISRSARERESSLNQIFYLFSTQIIFKNILSKYFIDWIQWNSPNPQLYEDLTEIIFVVHGFMSDASAMESITSLLLVDPSRAVVTVEYQAGSSKV